VQGADAHGAHGAVLDLDVFFSICFPVIRGAA
jgi:hypothetical protein